MMIWHIFSFSLTWLCTAVISQSTQEISVFGVLGPRTDAEDEEFQRTGITYGDLCFGDVGSSFHLIHELPIYANCCWNLFRIRQSVFFFGVTNKMSRQSAQVRLPWSSVSWWWPGALHATGRKSELWGNVAWWVSWEPQPTKGVLQRWRFETHSFAG